MKADHPSVESYAHAAWMLGCDVPAIMAVAEVESGPAGAFLDSGEPAILFEPHVFSRLTGGKHDGKKAPDGNLLSYPTWKHGAYGKASEQHAKLQAASLLDRSAALAACSWGLFQIMGHNYRRAGHDSLSSFINAAYRDVDSHLRMFVHFILADSVMAEALRTHAWAEFARRYNGAGYAANKYDVKMAAAHTRLSA